MKEKGVEVYHLAFGQSPFPIPKCFVDGLKKYADSHEYLPVSGQYLIYSIAYNIVMIFTVKIQIELNTDAANGNL